ncbi:MAG: radical SAM protein [Eubacteriales bacterium]|nr:radical SAM protein [Eubacteriales bacterium]
MKKRSDMECCMLCPRSCGVNRVIGQRGRCGMDAHMRIARAALHMWEEPCISGEEGSGTVFFAGCALGCVFCQNYEIAHVSPERFRAVSVEELADIFLRLQEQKANNINLVTAGQFLPQAAEAIEMAKNHGLRIPIVYNSSGYENVEALRRLEGLVDIYLPDMKYWKPETGQAYSRAADYPEVAKKAIAEMVRQAGTAVFDERGIMQKGVIVRHLLLPGHLLEAKKIVRYLYECYENGIYISLMSQYTPLEQVGEDPLLGRRVTKREYEKLLDFAIALGVENAFYQEGDVAKESFIPPFEDAGVIL